MADDEGVSILQTPSYILALLLLAFAVLFTVLERVSGTVNRNAVAATISLDSESFK